MTDEFTSASYHYIRARQTARRTLPLERTDESVRTVLAVLRALGVIASGSFAIGLTGAVCWFLLHLGVH